MPMPDAYLTRAKAFFDRCEKIDAPDIRALLPRWKRTGSRVPELGCGSDRDARFYGLSRYRRHDL